MFPIPIALWNTARRVSVTPSAGLLAISGLAPNVFTGRGFFPSVGSLAITGTTPIITLATGNIARTPSAGAMAITGTQLQFDIAGDQFIAPNVRAVTIIGQKPTVIITVPYILTLDGTLQNNATTSGTVTYNVVNTIPAGVLLVVAAGCGQNRTLTSASDNKGNTYVVDATQNQNSASVGLARCFTTTALHTGDTINLAWSGNATGYGVCVAFSNHAQASSADKHSVNFGVTNSSPATISTGSTGTLLQVKELALGVACVGPTSSFGAPGVFDPAGWTQLVNFTFRSQQSRLHVGYQFTNATTALNYQPTMTPGATEKILWSALISTYKLT